MHPYQIIEELRAIKGTNAKIDFLKSHQTDTVFKEVLRRTYEPRINYFLTPNMKMVFKGPGSTHQGIETVFNLLDILSNRELTGDSARTAYSNTFSALLSDDANVLQMILDRDIKAGIATTQINKVWAGLISETPYMRCVLPKDSKIKEWPWGKDKFIALSQTKEDGMFASLTKGSTWTVMSRNGSILPNGPYFEKMLEEAEALWFQIEKDSSESQELQFHGELLVKFNGVLMPREKGNGVLNSILKTGDDPGEGFSVCFVCWDCVPVSAVQKGIYKTDYATRFLRLQVAAGLVGPESFTLVETRFITHYEQAAEHFLEVTRRGGEGTIVKHPETHWKDGDSKTQVKMKIVFDCDLVVTGFNAGNGKNESTFGSMICESSDGKLVVGVSGFTDSRRKEIWEEKDKWVGKIVTVSSNNVMKPAKDGDPYSLFLPRFVEERLDKSCADSLERILAQFEAVVQGS